MWPLEPSPGKRRQAEPQSLELYDRRDSEKFQFPPAIGIAPSVKQNSRALPAERGPFLTTFGQRTRWARFPSNARARTDKRAELFSAADTARRMISSPPVRPAHRPKPDW